MERKLQCCNQLGGEGERHPVRGDVTAAKPQSSAGPFLVHSPGVLVIGVPLLPDVPQRETMPTCK